MAMERARSKFEACGFASQPRNQSRLPQKNDGMWRPTTCNAGRRSAITSAPAELLFTRDGAADTPRSP